MSDMTSDINPPDAEDESIDTIITHSYDKDMSRHVVTSSLINSTEDRIGDPGEVEGTSFMHKHVEDQYTAEDSKGVEVEEREAHHRVSHHPETSEDFHRDEGAGDEELTKKHDEDERFEVDQSWGRPTHHPEQEGSNEHSTTEGANETRCIVADSSGEHRGHHGKNQYDQQQPRSGDLGEPDKDDDLAIGYHEGIDGEESRVSAPRTSCDNLGRVSGDSGAENGEEYASRGSGLGTICAFDGPPTTSYFHHPKSGDGGGSGPGPENDGTEIGTDSGTSGSKRRVFHGAGDDKDEEADNREGKTKKREREQRQDYYQGLVSNGFRMISDCFVIANCSIRGIETDQRNMLESENEIGEELVKFGVRVREATQIMQAQILAAFTREDPESAPSGGQSKQPPDAADRDRAGESETMGIPRNSANIRRMGGHPNVGAKENIDRAEWTFGRNGAEGIQAGRYRSHHSRNEASDQESSREEYMSSFGKPIENIPPQDADDRGEHQVCRGRRPLPEVARGEPNDAGTAGGSETALKRPRWDSSLGAGAGASNAPSVSTHHGESEDGMPSSFLLHREQQSFLSAMALEKQNETHDRWGRE